MDEHEFITLLQRRSREQHEQLEQLPFPKLFAIVTTWLSDHPWRYLIPLAFLINVLIYNFFGRHFTEFVLKLFYLL